MKHKPQAIIVDIDGTVALKATDRSPYDWHRVGEDLPNGSVITVVRHMHVAGYRLIVTSGRMETCRRETEDWLARNSLFPDVLLMRAEGDFRPDTEVKREMFEHAIADHYNILIVFDDRQKVVDMWRELGLIVAQVAPGDF